MATKHRGRNEGSLFRKSDGKWRAQVSIEGKRLSYTHASKSECQAWIRKMTRQVEDGLTLKSTRMTFGEYFAIWIRTARQTLRPTTQCLYQRTADKYILPRFGHQTLKEMTPHLVELYLTELQENGIGDRTCQMVYALLHVVFASALRKDIIGRNPLDSVKKPKVRNPKSITILQPEQIHHLVISLKDHPNKALYFLAITTGLREGEILGLRWEDIDWNRSWIYVRRQVQRIDGQGVIFTTPKTRMGVRTLSIGPNTLDMLRKHRFAQSTIKEVAGTLWHEMDLVFPSNRGTPRDPHNLLKEFRSILDKAGLPRMRFHDLRHTSITLVLNDLNAPVREAQHRAGHASPTTTLNVYCGSTTTKTDEDIAQKLDELITPIEVELHPNAPERKDLHILEVHG
jgi:integrase